MRVISGQARGHKLKTPEGMNTRPTTDKIKESLFNMISEDIYDSDFLDLFCGSGQIGIEALSRGAKSAVFVDKSHICKEITKSNLIFTKLINKAEVYKQDYALAISGLSEKGKKFDIIFIDPPYEGGFNESVLAKIYEADLLKPDGFIILEKSSEIEINLDEIKGLHIYRTKDYKTTSFVFLRKGECS